MFNKSEHLDRKVPDPAAKKLNLSGNPAVRPPGIVKVLDKVAIALIVLFVIFGGVAWYVAVSGTGFVEPKPGLTEKRVSFSVNPGEYPNLASRLANRINEISPTPAFDQGGWLVKRISFVESRPYAYLEYTDTHVALRLLVEYFYESGKIGAFVLATFIPDELGSWRLHYGRDVALGLRLTSVVFSGDANQWIPESASERR